MSVKNIPQNHQTPIYKFICSMGKLFNIDIQRGWINGRPVLLNGNVWCLMCEAWHANNSECQR
jgi:hypothetical protein